MVYIITVIVMIIFSLNLNTAMEGNLKKKEQTSNPWGDVIRDLVLNRVERRNCTDG